VLRRHLARHGHLDRNALADQLVKRV
jgi:hypothetical protein